MMCSQFFLSSHFYFSSLLYFLSLPLSLYRCVVLFWLHLDCSLAVVCASMNVSIHSPPVLTLSLCLFVYFLFFLLFLCCSFSVSALASCSVSFFRFLHVFYLFLTFLFFVSFSFAFLCSLFHIPFPFSSYVPHCCRSASQRSDIWTHIRLATHGENSYLPAQFCCIVLSSSSAVNADMFVFQL